MIWVIIIVIVFIFIFSVNKDYKKSVDTHVTSQGGMLGKYKILLEYYADPSMAKIAEVTKSSVTVSYLNNNRLNHVILYISNVAGNTEISLKGLSPIAGDFSKKWKFPPGYPQEKMIQDIENHVAIRFEQAIRDNIAASSYIDDDTEDDTE